jgi:methionine-gamma-lyase
LPDHPGHELMKKMMHPDFGFGGVLSIDMGTFDRAATFMEKMELAGVGYLAVSLGYFKTLFSNSGKAPQAKFLKKFSAKWA